MAVPDCGASFVARNLSHSCVRRSVAEFFSDKPAAGVAHAKAFIKEARKLGPMTLHAVKTRPPFERFPPSLKTRRQKTNTVPMMPGSRNQHGLWLSRSVGAYMHGHGPSEYRRAPAVAAGGVPYPF
jgi:hypothetical protein